MTKIDEDMIRELRDAVDVLVRKFKIDEGNQVASGAPRMPPSEAHALVYVSLYPDRTMTNLAKHLGVAPTTASSIVDRMVKKGFLVRRRSEQNRRTVELSLTASGAEVCELIEQEQLQHCGTMLEALHERERDQFIRLIGKISKNLG